MISFNESKKILVVLAVLLVLALGIILVRGQKKLPEGKTQLTDQTVITQKPTSSPVTFELPGVYKIEFSAPAVKMGEKVEAKVSFLAKERIIFGSDVILRFDPSLLEADQEIIEGSYFSNYTRKVVDNAKGTVKVTAIRAKDSQPMTDFANFTTIVFKTKKSGTAEISFDFQKGKTNLTTLVEQGTSRNILGEVMQATLKIEQ